MKKLLFSSGVILVTFGLYYFTYLNLSIGVAFHGFDPNEIIEPRIYIDDELVYEGAILADMTCKKYHIVRQHYPSNGKQHSLRVFVNGNMVWKQRFTIDQTCEMQIVFREIPKVRDNVLQEDSLPYVFITNKLLYDPWVFHPSE
jgi:hypothetical protein